MTRSRVHPFGDPNAGGIEVVDELPEATPGKVVYLRTVYTPSYKLSDFDLIFDAQDIGGGKRGYATAAGAAASPLIVQAGGSLSGAETAGIEALAINQPEPPIEVNEAILTDAARAILGDILSVEGSYTATLRRLSGSGGYQRYYLQGIGENRNIGSRIRLKGDTGKYLLPSGTFADLGAAKPGAKTYQPDFYRVGPDGVWKKGLGGEGGIAAAAYLKRGNGKNGLDVGLRIADAGSDWEFRGRQRQLAVRATADIQNPATNPVPKLTVTLPDSLVDPEGGNSWSVYIQRTSSGSGAVNIDVATSRINVFIPAAGVTLTSLRTGILALRYSIRSGRSDTGLQGQFQGGDVVLTGSGATVLAAPGAGTTQTINFAGGINEEPIHDEVDEANKRYTVFYDTGEDTIGDIAAVLNAGANSQAVVVASASESANPENVGFERDFEGRRGIAGVSPTALTLNVAKATAAGVGVNVPFQSFTDDFLVIVSPDEAAPRVKLTLPTGKTLSKVWDSGIDITADFSREGDTQVWLSNVDYDGGGLMLIVRITT